MLITKMNTFEFRPAIMRNLELQIMLGRLKRTQDVSDPWESWLRNTIQATEQDLAEARQTKMTVGKDDHLVNALEKSCTASVSH